MAVMGRPKRGAVDVLKAKAWMEEAKRSAGVATAYALNQKVFGKKGEDLRYFESYQRGTRSPGAGMLRDIEKKYPGTSAVYVTGPTWKGKHVPIWNALDGSIEDVWEVLEWFDPAYARSRLFGFNQQHRIDYLLSQMVNAEHPLQLESGPVISDLRNEGMGVLTVPEGGLTPEQLKMFETAVWIYRAPVDQKSAMVDVKLENSVTRSWALGELRFDLRLLAATVSLWRLSHFLGEGWREMDYLLRGLILAPGIRFTRHASGKIINQLPDMNQSSAVGEVLKPLKIEAEFVSLIDSIWRRNASKYAAVVHSMSLGGQPDDSRS